MHDNFTMVVTLLFVSITAIAISKKFLKIPYPIVLVLAGLIIGFFQLPYVSALKSFISQEDIFGFIIISIFLPILLGEASLKLSFEHFKENMKPILLLSIVGTLITYIVIGFSSNLLLGFGVQLSFTFAALMSATDPLSVLSIFKSMNVSKKLYVVVEGESLLNDGVAVVLFNISAYSLIAYADRGASGIYQGVLDFIVVFGGGMIFGIVAGVGASLIFKLFDDSPLEIAFSAIMFYGVFLAAEHFHCSGIIAVVVSGLILGNYGAKIGMSPTTHVNLNTFWETMAFFANSIVFLMVGLELATIHVSVGIPAILAMILIVLVSRAVAVYVSTMTMKELPLSYKHVINWGGLKGSLSIALALSLPSSFPDRGQLLEMTFFTILFSIIVQGLSIKPLIKWLRLGNLKSEHTQYEGYLLKYYQLNYAMASLRKSRVDGLLTEHDVEEEAEPYKKVLADISEQLKSMEAAYPKLKSERIGKAREKALYAQYKAVEDLSLLYMVSEEVADDAKKEILDQVEKHMYQEL